MNLNDYRKSNEAFKIVPEVFYAGEYLEHMGGDSVPDLPDRRRHRQSGGGFLPCSGRGRGLD